MREGLISRDGGTKIAEEEVKLEKDKGCVRKSLFPGMYSVTSKLRGCCGNHAA